MSWKNFSWLNMCMNHYFCWTTLKSVATLAQDFSSLKKGHPHKMHHWRTIGVLNFTSFTVWHYSMCAVRVTLQNSRLLHIARLPSLTNTSTTQCRAVPLSADIVQGSLYVQCVYLYANQSVLPWTCQALRSGISRELCWRCCLNSSNFSDRSLCRDLHATQSYNYAEFMKLTIYSKQQIEMYVCTTNCRVGKEKPWISNSTSSSPSSTSPSPATHTTHQ